MKTEILHVEGMSCGHCADTVKRALQAVGVSAEVDLEGKKVEVRYDETKIGLETIKSVIEEQGYDVM